MSPAVLDRLLRLHPPDFEAVVALGVNRAGRDFVTGDIHGSFGQLVQLLHEVGFQTRHDRLICTGNLVNHGLDSEQAIVYLTQPWFHACRGAHEQRLIDAFHRRLSAEDEAVLRDQGAGWWLELEPRIQTLHIRWLETLPYAMEVLHARGRIGIVHGEVPHYHDDESGYNAWESFFDELYADTGRAREAALYGDQRFLDAVAHNRFWGPVSGVSRVMAGRILTPAPVEIDNTVYVNTGGWTSAAFAHEGPYRHSLVELSDPCRVHLQGVEKTIAVDCYAPEEKQAAATA